MVLCRRPLSRPGTSGTSCLQLHRQLISYPTNFVNVFHYLRPLSSPLPFSSRFFVSVCVVTRQRQGSEEVDDNVTVDEQYENGEVLHRERSMSM